MRHQRPKDRGTRKEYAGVCPAASQRPFRRQRTEVLLPLRGSLSIKARRSRDNELTSVLCLQSSERGSTLIISLIILIILMLLGVMAMNSSDTQYKMAGNLQFENMAMNNAEVAIDAAAERWLEDDVAARRLEAAANNTPLVQSASSVAGIHPLTMGWTDADSTPVTGPDGSPNDRQRYVIGFVSQNRVQSAGVGGASCPDPNKPYECVNTYLITARGQGGRGASKLVQVYYSVPQ